MYNIYVVLTLGCVAFVLLTAARWGAQTAHATLSDQPHLLSSKSSVLDSNGQTLQQLLGCSDKEMQRVVRKAPRCAIRCNTCSSNFSPGSGMAAAALLCKCLVRCY